MSIALITGATSGFGKAIALKFAEHGWDVIITGRREDRLRILEEQITSNYGSRVYSSAFDIRDREAVFRFVSDIPHELKLIDVLVNNAGLASGLSFVQDGEIDDWEVMIDTNLKGLLYISRAVIPGMVERNHGHVINIGSIAGKEAYAKGNVYCATKHAVDAINKSMRIDLLTHGIKVTSVNPGAAETEFSLVRFKGDAERAAQVYKGYTPLSADDVADVVYFAASRPPHVVLNDIIMTPLAQASTSYFVKDPSKL